MTRAPKFDPELALPLSVPFVLCGFRFADMTATGAHIGIAYFTLSALVCLALWLWGWYSHAYHLADKLRRQEKAHAAYVAARANRTMRAGGFTMEAEGIPGSDDLETSDVG